MGENSHDLAILATKLEALHVDVSDVKAAIQTMAATVTNAVSQLALAHERQAQAAASIGRAFDELAKERMRSEALEKRIHVLEVAQPANARNAIWVDRVTWAAAGLAVMYVVKASGLL